MRKSDFYALFALATLSGCLWFLAVTPFDFSALAWVAAVPALIAVERAPTFRQALFLGWWAGAVETAGGYHWIMDLMQRFADFPWWAAAPIFLLFCAARAVIFLLFAAIVRGVRGVRDRRAVPMTVLAPLAMVACEFVVPQLFPSGQFISQAWHPLVIQITELTGPLGVTALLMMVNGALYDLGVDGRGERRAASMRAAGAAAALTGAALIFGAVRMRQVDDMARRAPLVKIGLVQPNFAYPVTGELPRKEIVRQLAALQSQSRRLQEAGAQLLVWSEGSYPITLARNFSADFAPQSLARIRRGFDVPVVIGAEMLDPAREDAFNSAILLDGGGRAAGRYDKVRLLAFGEYVPGIDAFPWLRKLLPAGTGRFTAGAGPALLPFTADGQRAFELGPVICYEDILPGFLRRVGRLHPDLLVNLTSDSWFGADAEPWEHLALSVFAGVELRTSLVRAVNSGVSALIDPNGRVVQQSYADDPYRQPHPEDGLMVTAPMLPGGHTLYVAGGDYFAYLCIAATLILAGRAGRAGRRHPRSTCGCGPSGHPSQTAS